MSPITRRQVLESGKTYPVVFVGPADHTHGLSVDCTQLTADEIDQDGYVKPGVPLQKSGLLIPVAATPGTGTEKLFGVTIEPVKVTEGNTADDIAAAGVVDIAVTTIGQVNRAVAEDVLGRAYHADEERAFDDVGSTMVLLG